MKFDYITLTGADEATKIDSLVRLIDAYPRLEVGLLYSAKPQDSQRYPSLPWLHRAAEALRGRCAIHICGGQARTELKGGSLELLIQHAARVQVNGVVSVDEAMELASLGKEIILQLNASNRDVGAVPCLKVSLLVDASGGRGISPDRWDKPTWPACTKRVGFAGGLGPENLAEQLPLIERAASAHSWVDMESRLRRDDRFDLGLARECLDVFDRYATAQAVTN